MNQIFKQDYYRMKGKNWGMYGWLNLLFSYELRYLLYLRNRQQSKNTIVHKINVLKQLKWDAKFGLDILTQNIGKGLYLGHAHNINVSPLAIIGNNCNLSKGVTIGKENRGKREGAPTIGNCVWIGTNAVVVGNICVGDDVMIAPNSFVNCDVPSHSIVIGNPCKIIHCENATIGYISNPVE